MILILSHLGIKTLSFIVALATVLSAEYVRTSIDFTDQSHSHVVRYRPRPVSGSFKTLRVWCPVDCELQLSGRLRGGGLPSEDTNKKEGMSDAQKRIIDIETEMARTQKNKATMGHLCALKARLAALKRLVTEQSASKSGGPGEGFEVRATGDARVGFIGFPSVGKSTLLTKLTGYTPLHKFKLGRKINQV